MTSGSLNLLHPGFGLGGYIPRGIAQGAALPPPPGPPDDEAWMALALLEAMEGIGRASPNPSVGAVLVKHGQLLAKAATEAYGDRHAERAALALLPLDAARGACCYVTLEPCAGHGRQPPCAAALIASGVSRVVIAAADPHAKAGGVGIRQLREAGIEVVEGVLRREAEAWHFPFLAYQKKKAPLLIGKWAQTLDGHLADDEAQSQWISGPRSRVYTHWLRQKYDAIMVGAGTVLADQPSLTVRDSPDPIARQPHKIVIDPNGRLANASAETIVKLLSGCENPDGPLLFWCVGNLRNELPRHLAPFASVIVQVRIDSTAPLAMAMAEVGRAYTEKREKPLQSVLVEGGPQLLTRLLREDALDAAHIFIRAGILGGETHRIGRLDKGENPRRRLMERHELQLIATQMIDQDALLECLHPRWFKPD